MRLQARAASVALEKKQHIMAVLSGKVAELTRQLVETVTEFRVREQICFIINICNHLTMFYCLCFSFS